MGSVKGCKGVLEDGGKEGRRRKEGERKKGKGREGERKNNNGASV